MILCFIFGGIVSSWYRDIEVILRLSKEENLGVKKTIFIRANVNFVDYAVKMTRCFFISGKKSYLNYSECEF